MQRTVQEIQTEYVERQKELDSIRANYQRHMAHYARWLEDFKKREKGRYDTREASKSVTKA